jgi:hypothetical protein
MIKCGSGSHFGKVSVPDPDHTQQFSTANFFVTKSCLFNVRSSVVFQRVGLLFFIFDFRIQCWIPDPNPVPEQECISVPVPQRPKVSFHGYRRCSTTLLKQNVTAVFQNPDDHYRSEFVGTGKNSPQ